MQVAHVVAVVWLLLRMIGPHATAPLARFSQLASLSFESWMNSTALVDHAFLRARKHLTASTPHFRWLDKRCWCSRVSWTARHDKKEKQEFGRPFFFLNPFLF